MKAINQDCLKNQFLGNNEVMEILIRNINVFKDILHNTPENEKNELVVKLKALKVSNLSNDTLITSILEKLGID